MTTGFITPNEYRLILLTDPVRNAGRIGIVCRHDRML